VQIPNAWRKVARSPARRAAFFHSFPWYVHPVTELEKALAWAEWLFALVRRELVLHPDGSDARDWRNWLFMVEQARLAHRLSGETGDLFDDHRCWQKLEPELTPLAVRDPQDPPNQESCLPCQQLSFPPPPARHIEGGSSALHLRRSGFTEVRWRSANTTPCAPGVSSWAATRAPSEGGRADRSVRRPQLNRNLATR
jgi:hypothetical protein